MSQDEDFTSDDAVDDLDVLPDEPDPDGVYDRMVEWAIFGDLAGA